MESLSTVSLIGTVVVGISYLLRLPRSTIGENERRAVLLHTIRSATATAWPLFASRLFGEDATARCVTPSIAWMYATWWLDVRHIEREGNEAPQRGVRIEPHMLTALTFGLCGLTGAKVDAPYTSYIVYSLIACLLVALPQSELPPEDPASYLVSEVQRTVLLYAIATVVTSLCLIRTSCATIPAHS